MFKLKSYFMEKGISLEYYKHPALVCFQSKHVCVNRSIELTQKSVARENYDYRTSNCKSYLDPDRGLVHG